MKLIKVIKKFVKVLVTLAILACCLVLGVSQYMKISVKKQILTAEEAAGLEDVDCILILGAGVRPGGIPSPILQDRLDQGIRLYEEGVSEKLLMSGDHGGKYYNEVGPMKQAALEAGISSADVFMDHAGFSTYDSVYRAKEIFQAKKIVIVTQEYHLYRALYVARKLGIEAYGVAAEDKGYSGQLYRELREILARDKDFLSAVFKPEPAFLGDAVPVSGDGNVTNDP